METKDQLRFTLTSNVSVNPNTQKKGNKVSPEVFREAVHPKQEGVDSRFDVGQYFKDSRDSAAK